MSKTKEFHLGDILSVTTGRLVSHDGMVGVSNVLEFMLDSSVFDVMFKIAAETCTPHIFEQHPELINIDASEVTTDNWEEWLNEQIEQYGETLSVAAIRS